MSMTLFFYNRNNAVGRRGIRGGRPRFYISDCYLYNVVCPIIPEVTHDILKQCEALKNLINNKIQDD